MRAELYRRIDVWRKEADRQVFCYRVFQRLSDQYYCVQSKDGFSMPIEPDRIAMLNQQLLELFAETDLEDRENFYPKIDQAIEAFDADFEG